MPTSNTHFEQIPLEVVREIAKKEIAAQESPVKLGPVEKLHRPARTPGVTRGGQHRLNKRRR